MKEETPLRLKWLRERINTDIDKLFLPDAKYVMVRDLPGVLISKGWPENIVCDILLERFPMPKDVKVSLDKIIMRYSDGLGITRLYIDDIDKDILRKFPTMNIGEVKDLLRTAFPTYVTEINRRRKLAAEIYFAINNRLLEFELALHTEPAFKLFLPRYTLNYKGGNAEIRSIIIQQAVMERLYPNQEVDDLPYYKLVELL